MHSEVFLQTDGHFFGEGTPWSGKEQCEQVRLMWDSFADGNHANYGHDIQKRKITFLGRQPKLYEGSYDLIGSIANE